jgi:serine/threonine-protein kinase
VPRTPGAAGASPAGFAGTSSTPRSPVPRFVPGEVFAERYRIVGLLGRGGMGEVYRADDLRLGQAVALKFLPESLKDDPARRDRFYNEVRTARQVAHAAVCRVYDVADADGQPFLSMEYVDGEDLASLLRRIGRLPSDKALDIARQLCAGLAAAHERGVLHRDLKPDNVMLDGRGKVRITDFGLAGLAESFAGNDVRSGTPAYMSPEQLAGREVTTASDIYSLGLLLYELFTGRKAFEGRTLAELVRKQSETTPANPSTLVQEIDPAVEAVILRCLEKEPRLRPPSALAVAAALPGGDPLAAALAAGEIPSPEMVAAAGTAEGLRAGRGRVLLALGIAAMVLVPALSQRAHLAGVVTLVKPPAALEDRAQEALQALGHTSARVDRAVGFSCDIDYLQYVEGRSTAVDRWAHLSSDHPPVLQYWYRESPRPLVSTAMSGRVAWNNPPPLVSGMAGVKLDMEGRLVGYYDVPPQVEDARPGPASDAGLLSTAWSSLFAQARLDASRFIPDTPRWTPPLYADARAAWTGTDPVRPDLQLRIEAAAHRGRPVYFETIGEWTRPDRAQVLQFTRGREAGFRIAIALFLALALASVLLARHNVRLGRGDRAGARRLGLAALCAELVGWALGGHHVADLQGELWLFVRGFGLALSTGVAIWVMYLALEPYVRRNWPDTLISWTRLLAGRVRDPLVGRDVLLGASVGAVVALSIGAARTLIPAALGFPPPIPIPDPLDTLLGPRMGIATLADMAVGALANGMAVVLLRLGLRRALRFEPLAAGVFMVVLSLQDALVAGSNFWPMLALTVAVSGIPVYLVTRRGLLPTVVGLFAVRMLLVFPQAPSLGHWAIDASVVSLLPVLFLIVYGFHAARRGRVLSL